jgi:phosphohistidine phosphatase
VYIPRVKTILLMRHAKAEPGVPGQTDFERPLAPRGREDAERMGRAVAKLACVPDAIVSSPAARAKETAELAARAMKFEGTIRMERELYASSGEEWLTALRAVPASAGSALVVAHSPGIEEAAALACGASSGSFDVPTAGLLAFTVDAERWRDLEDGDAVLRWFLRPRMLGSL